MCSGKAVGQAYAAAQNITIQQRQHRFGVAMQILVKGVFLLEEHLVHVLVGLVAVVQHADVATGAEGLSPGTMDGHGDNIWVLFPDPQVPAQEAHHGQIQGVQRARSIQRQVADAVAYTG